MSGFTQMFREEDKARVEIALGVPVGHKLFAVSVSSGTVGRETHRIDLVVAPSEEEAYSILNYRHYDDFHRGFFRCYAATDVVEEALELERLLNKRPR